MTIQEFSDKLDRLEKKIQHHRELYYNKVPLISDEAFDNLLEKLRVLDPNSPVLQQVGSPPKQNKVILPFILGSLNKVEPSTVGAWLKKQNDDIVTTPKVDGVSVFARYNHGKLQQFTTRGDSKIGENLIDKAPYIKSLPQRIKEVRPFSARGEAVCTKLPPGYKNKRNAAAGILNRDDLNNLEYIVILFHELIETDKMPPTELQRLKLLSIYLPVISYGIINRSSIVTTSNINEIVAELVDRVKVHKDTLFYDVDGIVLTKNKSMRENAEYPSNKVAFKVQDAPQQTAVKFVEWNVTRTGRIVPVVHIDTVKKDGVEITHPTGHNYQWVKERKIDKGARIEVVRSGEVIPYIVSVIKPAKYFTYPNKCPSCNHLLREDGVDLVCDYPKCRGKFLSQIEHFIRTLGAENISVPTLDKLGISTIEDFYELEMKDIINIKGLGYISAENILAERSKTLLTTEEDFIAGLGIPNISSKSALKIVDKHFRGKLEKMFEMRVDKLYDIVKDEAGPSKADNFTANIYDYEPLYDFLRKKGMKFKKVITTDKLEGKAFQFTGAMSKPREDMEKLVTINGGRLASVSKNLDYLVIADPNSTSTKAQKARQIGIKMISEEKFLSMI